MTDNNILKALKSAEEDFRKAESKFDKKALELQRKASQAPISLALTVEEELYNLQGQANFNAKIVEEFASITADFKATCEAIILSLDTICRPLLKENPTATVIGEVSRFISKTIEDITDLKIDFSISLNSSDLGDIGSLNPKASIAVQTVERLWKEAYKGHPDYKKDIKRIKGEKDAEEERKKKFEKVRKENLNKAINKEKKIINDAASIAEKRELVIAECDERISNFEQKLFEEVSLLKNLMIETEKEKLQSELKIAKQELESTGFFNFSNKKVLKSKISSLNQFLNNPANSPNIVEQLNKIENIADNNLKEYKDAIKKHISTRFKLAEIRRDFGIPSAKSEWDFQEMLGILNFLASKDGPQKYDDIFEGLGYESNQKLSSIIRQLHSQGFLTRSENHGKAYYEISQNINVITIKIWKENDKEAKKGIPEYSLYEIINEGIKEGYIERFEDINKAYYSSTSECHKHIKQVEACENQQPKRKKGTLIISVICLLIALIFVSATVFVPALKKNSFINKYGQVAYDKFGNVAKGDYIILGSYELDGDTSNGKEDIEWVVLDINDGKVFLTSRYIITNRKYNNDYPVDSWNSSSLKRWLNKKFFNTAFSENEKQMISTTEEGQVFLLSANEAETYLISSDEKKCTEYNDEYSCTWWLRSLGYEKLCAYIVDRNGFIDDGVNMLYEEHGIRPAMWIDLSKIK